MGTPQNPDANKRNLARAYLILYAIAGAVVIPLYYGAWIGWF